MGGIERLLEYTVKGVLLLLAAALAALILGPFIIGYGITIIVWRSYDAIRSLIFPEKKQPPYIPSKKPLHNAIEKVRPLAEESEQGLAEVEAPAEQEEEQEEDEEPENVEFAPRKNLYIERKLKYGQKEALFAQGYKRLKISPYGDSGAAYYWVKPRYNESKEHAFFCYLIEKELRRYTKEVELFVNSGPDVIVRHGGRVYAFDVETGKNLNRKPKDTRNKFERYKEDYHRSYIFVTKKALKRKYKRMGVVITRSTLKSIIKVIFSQPLNRPRPP